MDVRKFDEMARSVADGVTRRKALRRIGSVAAGAGLALIGRGQSEAVVCRQEGRVCRENANCCSGICGEKNQAGRRTCVCNGGESLCGDKCCSLGNCYYPIGCADFLPLEEGASTEQLWRAIFESDALAPTMSIQGFAPRAGQQFQIRTAAEGKSESLLECEVLEVEFPTRLIFTWHTEAMGSPATAMLFLRETEKGLRIGVNRVGGDPASCDVATAMLGRSWQRTLATKALPQYLERMREA